MNVPAQRNGVSARLKTNLSWATRFWLGNALVFLMVGIIYWVGVSLSSNTPVVVFYLACTHIGWLGSFAIAGLLLHCLMGCAPQGTFRYAGVLAGSVFTVILLHDAIGTMGFFPTHEVIRWRSICARCSPVWIFGSVFSDCLFQR
jgi:membrane-anchored protein YejM (alkaline phosphatase superfamily)